MNPRYVILCFCILLVGAAGIAYQYARSGQSSTPIAGPDFSRFNLSSFERQVRHDLPVGTSKDAVDAYLTKLKIGHSYVGEKNDFGIADHTFYTIVEDFTWFLHITVDLETEIHLDKNEKVDGIKFNVRYVRL